MNDETLVKVEGLGKKFCKDLKRSLWYGVKDITTATFGGEHSNELRKSEFWSVKDISFTLKRGECIGLIGHNGAGKSTLLKMLNGLIPPDEGRIEMKGRVGALIELGAGFNPILTGRENIYNNGSVLGFTKQEIDDRLDSIIEFSEIEEFIDAPVQNYSSGMKVRLGFAVASHMDPDILIIDEVLAVGDIGFVLKCFNRIDSIMQNAAVIFVSHSMPQVARISSQILLMDKGHEKYQGTNVSEGIDQYYSQFTIENSMDFKGHNASIKSIGLNNINIDSSRPCIQIDRLADLIINLKIKVDKKIKNPEISLGFFDKEMRSVANFIRDDANAILENKDGLINIIITIPRIQFSKGIYSISISIADGRGGQSIYRKQSAAQFQIISERQLWASFQLDGNMEQL